MSYCFFNQSPLIQIGFYKVILHSYFVISSSNPNVQKYSYLGDDNEYVDGVLADDKYPLRNLHKYGMEFHLNSCPDNICMLSRSVSAPLLRFHVAYWAIVFRRLKNQNAVQKQPMRNQEATDTCP